MASIGLSILSGSADVITWTNVAGGAWNRAANWSPGRVPTIVDEVLITTPGTYNVTQDVSAVAARLTLGAVTGAQTLLSNGRSLTVAETLLITANGLLTENNNLTGAVVRVEGRLNWTGGTLVGPLNRTGLVEVALGGLITMTNNLGRTLNRMSVTNGGTVLWTQGALTGSAGNNEIWNVNLLEMGPNAPLTANWSTSGATSTNFIHNLASGRIRKSGSGSARLDARLLNQGILEIQAGTLEFSDGGTNSGPISLAAGSTLQLSAGPFDVVGGQLAGDGTKVVSGSAHVRYLPGVQFGPGSYLLDMAGGTLDLDTGSTPTLSNLRLRGGTLGGSDTVEVSGRFTWNGGSFEGLKLNAHGGLFITPPGASSLSWHGGRIDNWGDGQWTNGTIQTVSQGAPSLLHNHGQFELLQGVGWSDSSTPAARLVNEGLIRLPESAQATSLGVVLENRSAGTLRVTNTSLTLSKGGFNEGRMEVLGTGSLRVGSSSLPFEFRVGSQLAGDGQLEVNGLLRCLSTVSVGDPAMHLRFNSGQILLDQDSVLSVGDLDLVAGFAAGPGQLVANGKTLWQATDLRASAFLNCLGGLTLSSPSSAVRSFTAGIVRNAGIARWMPGTTQTTPGPSFITNALGGSLQIEDGVRWSSPGNNANRFVNEGSLTRNAGVGTVEIEGHFENAGTHVLRGALTLKPAVGVYHQSGGRTVIEGGSLRADGGTRIDGGAFEGNGEIDSTVTNAATIRPGASPGLLHIRRQFVQTRAGNLEIELEGTSVDRFDRLLVDGSASLDGLVTASFLGGFIPQPSDSFRFLTATGGRSGAFADLAAPVGPPWLALTELAEGAQLSVVTGPPQLAISLSTPAVTRTAEQSVDLEVMLSFPGGNIAGVTLAGSSGDPSIVANADLSFSGTGRVRAMRIHRNVLSSGSTVITVTATGEGGRVASAPLNLTTLPAPAQGMVVYEQFDYTPAGCPLSLKSGGFGFSGAWGSAAGYVLDTGSLPYPNMQQGGHRARIAAQPGGAQTMSRRLSTRLGDPGTVRYLSFLARPEGTLGAGGNNGYFGLLADTSVGSDLFVGKPGSGDLNRWVVEDAGGARQASSLRTAQGGTVVWLVVKLEFFPGNDRISLFVDPVPGQPEPATPDALRTDRDLGEILGVALTSTGEWSVDEVRVGTSWSSATPDPSYLAALAFQTVEDLTASEGTVVRFTPSLRSVITPRTPVFELVTGPPDMRIDPNTGAVQWVADENSGGTRQRVTLRVHDAPAPSTGQAEVTFQVEVQEANAPPGLNLISNGSLEAAQGSPFKLQLGFLDLDLPPNTVDFALAPGTGPAGLTISPQGLVEWTPPVDAPLGAMPVHVRLTDFNPNAPVGSQRLTTEAQFDLTVVTPRADMSVRQVTAPGMLPQGQSAQFQFEIENHGPSLAEQSQFIFQSPQFLGNPSRVTLVNAFNNHGSCRLQGDRVICDLGNLAMGERAGVVIELRFVSEGTMSFMASARSSLTDVNLSNNGNAGTVEVTEPIPQNPAQWQFTKIEELGETGYGACLATDRKGSPHSMWFNRSQRQIHYGTWDGLKWTVRLVNAPFSPQNNSSPSTVSTDISTPLSMAVDENYRVHLATSIQRTDLSRALVYVTPNRDNDVNAEWVAEEVFPGPVSSAILEIGLGTSPTREIWFVAGKQLRHATRGPSAVANWGTETIALRDGWTVADFGTTVAPISGGVIFLAGQRPDGTLALILLDTATGEIQVLDELARGDDDPIHISAKRIQGAAVAAYTRYPLENGLPEIAFVRREPTGWQVGVVNPPDRCSRPALSVTPQGEPLVAFTCTEQTADFTVFEDRDRFYRRLWYVGRFDGSVWIVDRVYETEEITAGLTLDQKRIRLEHPIDPALALGRDINGSPMIVLHTGWPNENVVFGTLAPRWTQLPTVANLGEGVISAPVLSLDGEGVPQIAWSDSHQTATDILSHKRLLPGFAYEASPSQTMQGRVHRDGLLPTPAGQLLTLLTDPLREEEARLFRWTAGATPWVGEAFPAGLRGAADGSAGLLNFAGEDSLTAVPHRVALGFDLQHRPIAFLPTPSSTWLPASELNVVSPDPAPLPVTAAFAVAQPRLNHPRAFMAYVVKQQTFRIRVAEFDGSRWIADEEVVEVDDSLPPLIDLEWVEHPPLDLPSDLGYLYLAYSLPAPNGQRTVVIARRHLITPTHRPWESISLANLPASYIQSFRLQGVQESLRLSVFGAGRALLVSSEGSLDTNQIHHATVERLPIAGNPMNVDMAMTDSRLWLAYQNQDRIELLGSGGFAVFSGNEIPRSPAFVPPLVGNVDNCDLTKNIECECFEELLDFSVLVGTLPDDAPPPPRVAAGTLNPPPPANAPINAIPDLHQIRDLMRQTVEGKRLVDLYYRSERTARQIANRNLVLYARASQMALNFFPALGAWLEGRGAEVTITRGMIEQLDSLWDTFAALGDAEFRSALLTERSRFHGFDDFIGKNMDEWAELLQIPSTAPNRLRILRAAFGGEGFFVTIAPQVGSSYTLLRKLDVEGATWEPVIGQSERRVAEQLVLNDPQPPSSRAFYRVAIVTAAPSLQ